MVKKSIIITSAVALSIAVIVLTACGGGDTGTLQFRANGEDFVRQGFVSKDGWAITFDHIYINLTDIKGYQSDPPYDPHSGGEVKAQKEASLAGAYLVDLAEGDAEADPILVGEVSDAPAGHYNAVHWKMSKAADDPAAGYALVIVGTAEKENRAVNFTIKIDKGYEYTCGEFVGDERKGMLAKNDVADLEMTFHFDHIFGDADTPLDDELNVGAPGFEMFAALAAGDTLDIDMAGLKNNLSAADYAMLEDILPTLGHVGEGHCHCEPF